MHFSNEGCVRVLANVKKVNPTLVLSGNGEWLSFLFAQQSYVLLGVGQGGLANHSTGELLGGRRLFGAIN